MAKVTGVHFGEFHTWDNWHLKMKSMKIGLPKVKTEYLTVPGMNGSLDLTEAQNGGVKYEDRELEFVFDARNCNYANWDMLISTISAAIHGQKRRIIIDINPGYYYLGRCTVETSKTNEVNAEIVIKCICEPFKIDIAALNEPWVWDSFSFTDGVIRKTHEVDINSATGWQKVTIDGWIHNEVLKIITDTQMLVRFEDQEYRLESGENRMYEMEITEGRNDLYFQGVGKIMILQIGGMI
ncbi:hypothetical protein EDD74_1192 [Faecalimonas umbilicata]|uniref:Uncharacterized protein n=1 Tax=Faecalimonas umbilicata TaxID=1912855 RepID=A0A4R3JL21_9FIRM|nr:hypothetical protein [Faecalimonas umbilicata]TCS66104.1 hypothetical protein EDD74_1192 [Faecalimonas umbilicata]GBU06579.1 hypothetical protein FAEUMB_31200 [Faecalimonas umbilicata]